MVHDGSTSNFKTKYQTQNTRFRRREKNEVEEEEEEEEEEAEKGVYTYQEPRTHSISPPSPVRSAHNSCIRSSQSCSSESGGPRGWRWGEMQDEAHRKGSTIDKRVLEVHCWG